MGLSFWLVPTLEDEISILKDEMKVLREANSSCASSAFPPHATLIAGLKEEQGWDAKTTWRAFQEGLEEWKKVEREVGPIVCNLNEVTTRGLYFQCILLALEKKPSLLSLNAQMRSTFSAQDQPEYFPHCSLLYAPLSSEEAEKQIAEMRAKGVFSSAKEGEVVFGSGARKMKCISFGAIELWDSNGPVEKWKRLERIQL